MTCDVFYVTYDHDAEWFRWSTAVLEQNLKGYRQIIAVAPIQDREIFDGIAAERKSLRMVYIPDWPKQGYYWQQWVKMSADHYTDADFIIHQDSDVFVTLPYNIGDLFPEGKPCWLWSFYNVVGGAACWRPITEWASGLLCEREFMRGFPFVFPRILYATCREHLTALHGDYEQYIRSCAPPGMGFSEFNFMGRIAWEELYELFQWVHREKFEWPAFYLKNRQFWSYTDFSDCLEEIKSFLNPRGIVQTPEGIWVLEEDTHISRWVGVHRRLDFDQHNLSAQCRHINPGDVAVDVGAFIGDNTLAYAVAGAKVIAFEPNLLPFACLFRNLKEYPQVRCENIGLSDSAGEMRVSPDPNVGASHLTSGAGVRIRTLDSYNLTRLNFMKIDAEGMELRILQGAQNTIASCRPVIFIEINRGALKRAGTSAEEVRAWLEANRYAPQFWDDGAQFDVLCLPEDSLLR